MQSNFAISKSHVMGVVVLSTAGIVVGGLLALSYFGTRTAFLLAALSIALLIASACLWRLVRSLVTLQASSRKLSLIADMSVEVNQGILLNEDIELIYSTILKYLFSIFNNATTGSVLILGEDGYLRFAASRGFTDEFVRNFHLKLEDSFLYQVTNGAIQQTRLINNEDLRRIRTVFEPGAWEYRSVISAPLFVGNRLFGILNLDSPVTGTYDRADVKIVERFKAQIEVGLLARERYTQNIKRYQIDSLTGLLTRRYFEDLCQQAMARAQRNQETLVLALFDVDGLKVVNDNHGHLAGDHLLVRVADALRLSSRSSDIIGRLGGDEFIAVYPLTEPAAIEKTISESLIKLRSESINLGDSEYQVSFSYGLAIYPIDGTTQDSLIAAADKRLYAMKSAVGNKLAFAD